MHKCVQEVENKRMATKGKGGGEGINYEFEISNIHTTLCKKDNQ